MKDFEARYFPFKRFSLKHKRFYRFREWRWEILSAKGELPVVKKLTLPPFHPENGGKILAFLSDWHWHASPSQQRLLSGLSAALGKIKPDILLLGGDLCDDAEFLPQLPVLLGQLGTLAPAVFAVNGNWEAGKRWLPENYFRDLYAQHNIQLLENQTVICGGFRITGLPDISSINFRQLAALSPLPDKTDLLITHNPDGVVAAGRTHFLRDFALAFCGHTHGGQIRMPLFGALYCPSFYRCKFDRGIFGCRGINTRMIVSSGIGERNHSFRFNCPPEVLIVEFK